MPEQDIDHARRRYLKGAASAGLVALAGCGGGDGDGNNDPGQSDQYVDGSFTLPIDPETEPLPHMAQFNPYAATTAFASDMIFDRLAIYDHVNGEFLPEIAESWDVSDETVTLHLNQDYTWTNGDDLIAEDLKIWFRLQQMLENGLLTEWIDGWSVQDDHTIEVTRAKPGENDRVFLQNLLNVRLDTPRAQWSDAVETAWNDSRNADNENLRSTMNQSLGPDEAVTNGPFTPLRNQARRSLIFERHDGHPLSDQNLTPNLDFLPIGGQFRNSEPGRALEEGTIDHFPNRQFEESTASNFPDTVRSVVSNSLIGDNIHFNLNRDWVAQTPVRQAIMMATDMTAAAGTVNTSPPPSRITGMTHPVLNDNWLSDVRGSFTDYGGAQTDTAADLMREAGYQRNSEGMWADASGSTISTEIPVIIRWYDAVTIATYIADKLTEFGIDATQYGVEYGQFTGQWENGNFDMILYNFGTGTPGVWHPYFYYNATYASSVARNKTGRAREYDVPATIGDPESATETVDAEALARTLEASNEESEVTETVERLGWTFNQTVPTMYLDNARVTAWYSQEAWNMPAIRDPENPPEEFRVFDATDMLGRGYITPKEK